MSDIAIKVGESLLAIYLLTTWRTPLQFVKSLALVGVMRFLHWLELSNMLGTAYNWRNDDHEMLITFFKTYVDGMSVLGTAVTILLSMLLVFKSRRPRTNASKENTEQHRHRESDPAIVPRGLQEQGPGIYKCISRTSVHLCPSPDTDQNDVSNPDPLLNILRANMFGSEAGQAGVDPVSKGDIVFVADIIESENGRKYILRLDGLGYYPLTGQEGSRKFQFQGVLPSIHMDGISVASGNETDSLGTSIILPPLPTGSMLLRQRADKLKRWIVEAETAIENTRSRVEQQCLTVHASHQQVIDKYQKEKEEKLRRIKEEYDSLVHEEEQKCAKAVQNIQQQRKPFINESKNLIKSVLQEAKEAENVGTFWNWMFSYTNELIPEHSRDSPKVEEIIPEEFLCPIGKEVMQEPVIATCGHTFEKRHLERWLEEHHSCPECRSRMKLPLIRNLNLRHAIEKWCVASDAPVTLND